MTVYERNLAGKPKPETAILTDERDYKVVQIGGTKAKQTVERFNQVFPFLAVQLPISRNRTQKTI